MMEQLKNLKHNAQDWSKNTNMLVLEFGGNTLAWRFDTNMLAWRLGEFDTNMLV